MAERFQVPQTGDALFEAFVEQVKQALDHLYDFAYLQQHSLARIYDGEGDLSAKTAGRKLRYDLITAIESLKPQQDTHFRAPDARLYNLLHLYYVESITIQEAAGELGLSERQAYRDLKRGQETVAAVLWNNRLPHSAESPDPSAAEPEFSLDSEVARLKLHFSLVDVGAIIRQACNAVGRLAEQQNVEVEVSADINALTLSTDPSLAHQVIVSVLSYAIQQARYGRLLASFDSNNGVVTLSLLYEMREGVATTLMDSPVQKLARRLRWSITYEELPHQFHRISLHMASSSATVLVVDDNEGWIGLLERFLEGSDCMVVALQEGQDCLQRVQELNPSAIILDVMMPERDGWELLQRLRAQPTTANMPIIVCTVFNDPQLAYSLGASIFLPKPTSREQVLEALKQLGII